MNRAPHNPLLLGRAGWRVFASTVWLCGWGAGQATAQVPAGPESANAKPARVVEGESASGKRPGDEAGVPATRGKKSLPTIPLKAIEAGTADLSPLARSVRALPIDLRAPTNFDRVYEIPASDRRRLRSDQAGDPGQSVFARMSGGLTAIFPRSTYLETKLGAAPTVPPGTVFWIGRPFREPWEYDPNSKAAADGTGEWSGNSGSPGSRTVAVSRSARRPASAELDGSEIRERGGWEQGLWTDEARRAAWLESVVKRAADEQHPTPSGVVPPRNRHDPRPRR